MKSAHEVLLDDRLRNLQIQEETRTRDRIHASLRRKSWPWLVLVSLWPLFTLALNYIEPASPRYIPPLFTLFYFLMLQQWVRVTGAREWALREAIKKDAPELHAKLRL